MKVWRRFPGAFAAAMLFASVAAAQTAAPPATAPAPPAPKPSIVTGISGHLSAGTFSADGRTCALVGANGLFVLKRGAAAGEWTLSHVGTTTDAASVVLSPDATYAAVGLIDRTVAIITLRDGITWRTLGCRDLVLEGSPAIAGFLDQNRKLVAGGSRVGVWSVGDGQLIRSFALPVQQNRMALSPDGKMLATGWTAAGGIQLVDMASGRPLPRQPEVKKESAATGPMNPRGLEQVRFTADGRHVYGESLLAGGMFFYNVSDGTQAGRLRFDHFSRGALTDDLAAAAWGTIHLAATTPPPPLVVAPMKDAQETVGVMLTANKKVVMRSPVDGGVGLVVISGDGRTLIAATEDKVLLWNLGQ